jgi:hypothetical protein
MNHPAGTSVRRAILHGFADRQAVKERAAGTVLIRTHGMIGRR